MRLLTEKIPKRILIAISGLLIGISIIFADIGFIAYFAMIPLALALFARTEKGYRARSAYLDGFIFYMCLDLVAFHWFVYFYPLDFAGFNLGESILIIALAWVGLSLLQSVFSALVFVVISLISRTEAFKRHPILLAPVAAALVAVNEWTQTFTWAGVPWSRIAISQTEMPILMQSASLFGSYFLTFIVVLFNFILAYAIICEEKRRLAAVCAAVLMLANIAVGSVLYLIPTVDKERGVKVAAVQGNLESQSNYDISLIKTYEIYERQTRAAAEEGAEIIFWPEGAIPVDIHDGLYVKPNGYDRISVHLSKLSAELGVTLAISTYFKVGENEVYNSISAFYPNGESRINAYAKVKPVPFGEYMPMRDIITAIVPQLAEINLLSTDVTAGSSYGTFGSSSEGSAISVGTLMCYDSIYEETAIGMARAGAEMLVVPSNDSWFYNSRALNMHHSQNILRAVEQGKYTVSCGNTGMTSIVTDKGKLVRDMPIYTEGYVLDTVYASSGRTLYSYIGNLFVYICIAFVVGLLIVDKVKFKKR